MVQYNTGISSIASDFFLNLYFILHLVQMNIYVLDSTSDLSDVQEILHVSNEVFSLDAEKVGPLEPPYDIKEWLNRLQLHNGEIIYYKDPVNGLIGGFLFLYQRSDDPAEQHIWIAGCRSQLRRQGVMSQLFIFAEKRKRDAGIKTLTVNTYPLKFPNMPYFLGSQQYEVYSRVAPASSSTHIDLGSKWCYRKILSI